jgi:glycine/D-amino acid oxidase-like deaminating enzyme
MRTKTTVIVGGGVNGLSIAYWHGRMKENHQCEVIVLEARNQCFQGASGYNSGLLSWHWFSDELRQLAHHSFRIYQNLAREAVDFKEICDYHEDSLFQAHCGEGHTDHYAPAWMKTDKGWYLQSEPSLHPDRQRNSRGSAGLSDYASTATMYVLIQILEL